MQEQAADHAQRLRRIFGEVLPESSTDDGPDGADESPQDRDRWLRDNRPPHHDGQR